MISKILFPLLLYTFIEQNIFFPESCFAYPIFEQKFMVCFGYTQLFSTNNRTDILEISEMAGKTKRSIYHPMVFWPPVFISFDLGSQIYHRHYWALNIE